MDESTNLPQWWQIIASVLAIITPPIAGVFGAMLKSQTKLVETLERQNATCEAREERRVSNEERKANSALERMDKQTVTIDSLSGAVREFGPLAKAAIDASIRSTEQSVKAAGTSEKNGERLETLRREVEGLRNEILFGRGSANSRKSD